jgi:hypothetical protein
VCSENHKQAMSVYSCEACDVGLYISMMETVPLKPDPQMLGCIMEKSWLNLCLCVIIAGTKNVIVVSQREERS